MNAVPAREDIAADHSAVALDARQRGRAVAR